MYKIIIFNTETGETLVNEETACIYAGIAGPENARDVAFSECDTLRCSAAIQAVAHVVHPSMTDHPEIRKIYELLEPEKRRFSFFKRRGGDTD